MGTDATDKKDTIFLKCRKRFTECSTLVALRLIDRQARFDQDRRNFSQTKMSRRTLFTAVS